MFSLSTIATISWKLLWFIATSSYLSFSMNIIFSRVNIPAFLNCESSSLTNILEMIKFSIKVLGILILRFLATTCSMILVLYSWGPIPVISPVYSSIRSSCTFNDLIALLHPLFAFINVKISIKGCLVSGYTMALITAELNYYRTCVTLVNEVDFSPKLLNHISSS